MKFADTHAHLHFPHFNHDLEQLIKSFPSKGVEFVVNVGIDVKDSEQALALAIKYERIYCSVGIHPHEASKVESDYVEKLEKLSKHEKVVAIGETGLDYYRNLSSHDDQKKVFREQVILARELDLPVIIHIRDAYEDAYRILCEIGLPSKGGVVHAFSADSEWALKFVEMGLFIGIGGPITYPKNVTLKSVVRAVGLENILTETDCPYLPPQQFRGKRNEPSYIRFVLEEIASILNEKIDHVARVTLENAKELFSR